MQWKSPEELLNDNKTSVMVHEMIKRLGTSYQLEPIEGINPGNQFMYTTYKLFL